MTDEDKKKLEELELFKAELEKLFKKYPHVAITCDEDDNVKCYTSIYEGAGRQFHELRIEG
jgi:hypothetical protein